MDAKALGSALLFMIAAAATDAAVADGIKLPAFLQSEPATTTEQKPKAVQAPAATASTALPGAQAPSGPTSVPSATQQVGASTARPSSAAKPLVVNEPVQLPSGGVTLSTLSRTQSEVLRREAARKLDAVVAAGQAADRPQAPVAVPKALQSLAPVEPRHPYRVTAIWGPVGREQAEVQEPSGRIGIWTRGQLIGSWRVASIQSDSMTLEPLPVPVKASQPRRGKASRHAEPRSTKVVRLGGEFV